MSIETFRQRVGAVQDIETRMGEVAAVLSELADALTNYPDGIAIEGDLQPLPPFAAIRDDAIPLRAEEWPVLADIQELLIRWHTEMEFARRVWRELPPDVRELVMPPDERGEERLRAVL